MAILAVKVKALHMDSRKVTKGDVFIAIKGVAADGHQFIDSVAEKGAVAVICEDDAVNIKGRGYLCAGREQWRSCRVTWRIIFMASLLNR